LRSQVSVRPWSVDGLPVWQVATYLAVVAALLTAFATSSFEPFQERVLGETSGLEVTPSTWLLRGGNLLPGAYVTTAVVVRNPSTATMRISLTASSSAAGARNLGDALYLVLKTVGHGCDGFDGRTLARGPVGSFKLGDPTPGEQPGDQVFGPGASQTYCLRAMVPVNTGNEFQGASTRLRLDVFAEAVARR
jgi:hypothetical protein